jgi:hypothetical protein
MAQEARKPIFHLTPADGAIGSHIKGFWKRRRTSSRFQWRLPGAAMRFSPEAALAANRPMAIYAKKLFKILLKRQG